MFRGSPRRTGCFFSVFRAIYTIFPWLIIVITIIIIIIILLTKLGGRVYRCVCARVPVRVRGGHGHAVVVPAIDMRETRRRYYYYCRTVVVAAVDLIIIYYYAGRVKGL